MDQFSSDKIFKHLDRLVEWQENSISRPVTYELDMTNLCDSRCPFCFGFYQRERDKSSLGIEEAKDIVGQIKEFGGRGLTFTGGGEPLCNPATLKVVRYAKKVGLDIGFITNGISLTKEGIEILVDCCTWLRVSLDAGSEKVYERTHGLDGKIFNKLLNNINLLAKKKQQRNAKLTIGTGFLTFPEVSENMVSFVKVSREAGVDYAQFRPLHKKFYQKEINEKPIAGFYQRIEECQKMTRDNFRVLYSVHKYESMKNGEVGRKYRECHGHHFAVVVAANRKMYLCCHMRGLDKYCIGDLSENALAEIWRSEQRRNVYENIDFRDCPLLCRCDGLNNVLWNICQERKHVNFL